MRKVRLYASILATSVSLSVGVGDTDQACWGAKGGRQGQSGAERDVMSASVAGWCGERHKSKQPAHVSWESASQMKVSATAGLGGGTVRWCTTCRREGG